jgi:hypothetical protein
LARRRLFGGGFLFVSMSSSSVAPDADEERSEE